MSKIEEPDKIEEFKKYLLNKNLVQTYEVIETFYSIFENVEEFKLKANYKGVIKTVNLILKSDFLNNKFFDNKETPPFAFIINDKWLTFYFRINHKNLVTNEIKNSFDLPKKQNNSEFKIYLKNKEDVIKLMNIFFIKKLKLNNIGFKNIDDSENNVILKILKDSNEIDSQIIETVKQVLTVARTGQQKYRNLLLEKWNYCCSVTNINQTNILKASHIKPFSESNDYEKYDVENGLLLSPNLDNLFDLHLISFDEKGLILLSKSITNEIYEILGINEKLKLRFLTRGMIKYLTLHKEIFDKFN
jgi:hypothetical protein